MSDIDTVWKNKNISKETKMRLFKALIPSALYGCEAWTLKKAEGKQLLLFEKAAQEDTWHPNYGQNEK